MKNIKITIIRNQQHIHTYVSDILPLVGDLIEVPEITQEKTSIGLPIERVNSGKGLYVVVDRLFIANSNQVKLSVDSITELL